MNIRVTETAENIRGIARTALKGNWKAISLGMIIYMICFSFVIDVLAVVFPNYVYYEIVDESISMPFISYLYMALMAGPISLGLISFVMSFFRKGDINPGYVFNGFGHFFKAFAMTVMRGILSAWPLFFAYVVFGVLAVSALSVSGGNLTGAAAGLGLLFILIVIAACVYMVMQVFAYSQCFYLLCTDLQEEENPDKRGIMRCLKDSKIMMKGNKGKLFCLEISYFGWIILASIPSIIVSTILESIGTNQVATVIINFIASLPMAFFYAYYNTGMMVFHDLLVGKLIPKPPISEYNEY